jgi:hypothetical protein
VIFRALQLKTRMPQVIFRKGLILITGGMVPMDHSIYQWHRAYWAAVCETDDSLMPGRILIALAAIQQRRLAPLEIDADESAALKRAEHGLQVLKAERVHETNEFTIDLTFISSQSA